jgi:hypothetical protein
MIDNDIEYTVREEWRDATGEEVKSNVHVTLKKGFLISSGQGVIS